MTRSLVLLATVAWVFAVLLAGVAIPAGDAFAIGNGKFSVAPASSSESGRTTFSPVLSPGVPSKDQVVVVNETNAPLTLQLYAADAHTTKAGAFAVQANFKPKKDMGEWIHLPVSTVTIPARSGDVIPFTYDPPAAAAPGDYAGGIVAEQVTGTIQKQKGTVRVQALQAVGVAVYGRIQGKLIPRLAVSGVAVSTSSSAGSEFGGPVNAKVTFSVTNTGNETLKPVAAVSLSPFVGGGPSDGIKLPQVLPGSTVQLSHTFDGVSPYGAISAHVKVSNHGAEGSGSGNAVIIPWGIVAILVLLAVALYWRRRHRRDGSRAGRNLHGPARA